MKISVCTGPSCTGRFSEYIVTRLKNDKERFNLETLFIEESPCSGNCKTGPNIKVDGDSRPYMNPAKASMMALNNGSGKKKKKKKKNKNSENTKKPESKKPENTKPESKIIEGNKPEIKKPEGNKENNNKK